MEIRFCPLFSGSSGNATYVGAGDAHILIDAGAAGKTITGALEAIGVNGAQLEAILITHEHGDHIAGAGVMSRRYDIPIYATAPTWEEMEGKIGSISGRNMRVVTPGQDFFIGPMSVLPVSIPHDAAQPVGFQINVGKRRMGVFTDIGHASSQVEDAASRCDILLLEANHDIEMLKKGPYPAHLKARILGRKGHLSNGSCAELLAALIDKGTRNVYLGHLSDENNHPELALSTVMDALLSKGAREGVDFAVTVARRSRPSQFFAI